MSVTKQHKMAQMSRKDGFMKKAASIIFVFVFCLSLIGCGSGNNSAWKNDEASTKFHKGMSASMVKEKLGQPNKKFSSDDIQVWEYKKTAEADEAITKFMTFGTFGIASGSNSWKVDVLKFKIKNNVVIGIETEENVGNYFP